jgi:GT2 family glycosyltransferase
MASIAVLMTSHNRRAATLAALQQLRVAGARAEVSLAIFLVDAGSTDGTVEEVRRSFPEVSVDEVGPDVFWGTGMSRAGALAVQAHCDYHLWLNDDVELTPGAMADLLACARSNPRAVVVGQLQNADGAPTYGGFRRGSGVRRMRFDNIGPSSEPQFCDSLNGNVVLVPGHVVARIGGVDPAFPHAFGDIDYGLRARKAGFDVVQAPGFVGECARNPPWRPRGGPWARLRQVSDTKHLPFRAWWVFCWRHGGMLAPLFFARPYLQTLVRGASPPETASAPEEEAPAKGLSRPIRKQ